MNEHTGPSYLFSALNLTNPLPIRSNTPPPPKVFVADGYGAQRALALKPLLR